MNFAILYKYINILSTNNCLYWLKSCNMLAETPNFEWKSGEFWPNGKLYVNRHEHGVHLTVMVYSIKRNVAS